MTSLPKAHAAATRGVDILDCDREPIRIPGSIQPHGVLLLVGDTGIIEQVSVSVSDHFGKEALQVLGKPLVELLGEAT